MFIIIFGLSGVTLSTGKGTFFCPNCDGRQEYRYKTIRNFFTLYFIPLIPLNKSGEYVQCKNCGQMFDTSVLEYNPEELWAARLSDLQVLIRQALVGTAVADGALEDDELDQLRAEIAELTGQAPTIARLRQDGGLILEGVVDPPAALRERIGSLDERDKERLVQAALRLAWTEDGFTPARFAQVRAIADALQMTPAHFRGVLAEVEETL